MAEAYTKVKVLTMGEGGGGEGGTTNYNDLSNKPKINGTTLSGSKTLEALGIAAAADLTALETEVDGKQDAVSDLATIRSNASDGKLAHTLLTNDNNYIELTAEDSDTHEVTTFKIFGEEIEEGGGV